MSVRSSGSELDRRAAARDCWPGGTLRLWQGELDPLPDRVLWPTTPEEVHQVLRDATAARVPVVTYGAGSGVCGGARGRPGEWVLDTKALDQLGPLDRERWSVRAGAGVNGQQLEDWLQARGFTLGHSPSSIACSTVGGWAAARSAGQFSSKYGVFEDMVLGLEGVAPSTGPFRVGAGGDRPAEWLELLLGSEGTLAVLTEVEMRVWPTPAARVLGGWEMPDLPTALGVMRELMQGELHPSVVRLYDPVDTRIGGRTRPKTDGSTDGAARRFVARWLASVDRLDPVHRNSLVLPLGLPRLVNGLLDRVARGCLLIVGWEGDAAVVDAASRAGHQLLDAAGAALGPDPGQRWYASRHAVSYKLMPVFERGGFADTMEVAGRWSVLEAAYHAIRGALGRTAVVMAHVSHVYPEGACIYFSFAGRGDRSVYAETWRSALDAAVRVGVTVAHHHGIGESKVEAATREVGPAVEVWRALKAELDPAGILNPGRLFGPPSHEAPSVVADAPTDGLGPGGEAMWPFEPGELPARWHRSPWQTPWIEVAGTWAGRPFRLGRGPRSAVGPDLRGAVARAPDVVITRATAAPGPRWMGEGRPEAPWAVARALLASDLRPAVLGVRDGVLRVGFRGPAAAAFGAIASARVPGGLVERPYAPEPLPAGPLRWTTDDDPAAVGVTAQGVFRRAT